MEHLTVNPILLSVIVRGKKIKNLHLMLYCILENHIAIGR